MATLPTGIDALDRQLKGGLAGGNLVALVSPPDAPGSRLLYQLMRERPTTYVTTLRSRSAIETELEQLGLGDVDVTIEAVGDLNRDPDVLQAVSSGSLYDDRPAEADRVLDQVLDVVDGLEGSQNLIVDPMNSLERTEDAAYERLLRATAGKLRAVDGLGVFHCLSFGDPPRLREQTLTMADTVWNLEVGSADDELELRMRVPKNRGGEPVSEVLTLRVDRNRVYTDRSRGI